MAEGVQYFSAEELVHIWQGTWEENEKQAGILLGEAEKL